MGQSALERWQELLAARAHQMDAAYARLGRTSADFWHLTDRPMACASIKLAH